MRRARKVDGNQAMIVDALRAVGYSVEVLSDVGRGVPDLMIGDRGRTVLAEVKRDVKASFTPVQLDWAAKWKGGRPLVFFEAAQAVQLAGITLRGHRAAPGFGGVGPNPLRDKSLGQGKRWGLGEWEEE